MNSAHRNAFPQQGLPYPYSDVHCLLLKWESDDLSVQDEITALAALFEDRLHFSVEQWQIPDDNSKRALQEKLYTFQDLHQQEDELLIVYYGGHGEFDRRGRSIWRA